MTAAADTFIRDSLHAHLSRVLSLADSLRVSGELHIMQAPASSPGWFEQWGIAALVNVIAVGFLGWLVQSRLQSAGLGHQAILALFTHRSGLLSEVQLKAAQETWLALSAVQSRFDGLVSPLKTVAVPIHAANDFEAAKEALRAQEAAETALLLKDNADLFAVVQRHKPFLPKTLFEQVSAYASKLLQVNAFLEERREFQATLPSIPLKERPAAAHRARDYGKKRDDHVADLKKLAEAVEEEIRRLTTPELPGRRSG